MCYQTGSDRKKNLCPTCRVPWVRHLGIQCTCAKAGAYRKALEAIRAHMEVTVPNGHKMSTVWFMANKALEENQ